MAAESERAAAILRTQQRDSDKSGSDGRQRWGVGMESKGWTQANGLDLPPLTWLRYRWLRLSRQPLVGGGMLRARAVADVQ
jgi:hypothetical protein